MYYFRFESESDLLAHIQAVENEDQAKPETNKLEDAAKPKYSLQQDGSKPESSKQKDGSKLEEMEEVKIIQPEKEIVKCSRFKDLHFYPFFFF